MSTSIKKIGTDGLEKYEGSTVVFTANVIDNVDPTNVVVLRPSGQEVTVIFAHAQYNPTQCVIVVGTVINESKVIGLLLLNIGDDNDMENYLKHNASDNNISNRDTNTELEQSATNASEGVKPKKKHKKHKKVKSKKNEKKAKPKKNKHKGTSYTRLNHKDEETDGSVYSDELEAEATDYIDYPGPYGTDSYGWINYAKLAELKRTRVKKRKN